MKSLLFTFDDSDARRKFVQIIKEEFKLNKTVAPLTEDLRERSEIQQFMDTVLSTAQDDPCVVSPEHRHCSVWISGKKIVEGDFKKMNERFMQECGVHSASVVLKELKSNEWCDIRTRRIQ